MSLVAHNTLHHWPKIELHRHLEGSVLFETAVELARQTGIIDNNTNVKDFDRLVRWQPDDPANFALFLSKFATLRRLYVSRNAVERVAREAIEQAAADNIRYIELRFNPDHYAETAGRPLELVTEWILDSATAAATAHGIMVRFLLTINRNYDRSKAEATLHAALSHRDHGVVGLDLAGDETLEVATEFAHIFRRGAAAGLGITIHAGEAGPPENIWTALAVFGATRIGHGIQCVSDRRLLSMLAARNIALEVCPTSNIQTGVVPNFHTHPLRHIMGAGLPVTLNTDDPCLSRITLSSEYEVVHETLGISLPELREMVLNGARYAFLPDHERQHLIAQLATELDAIAV